jgi:hypothetical protein
LLRSDWGIGGYLQTDQLNRIETNGSARVQAESMRVMMAQFNMTRAHQRVHVRRAIATRSTTTASTGHSRRAGRAQSGPAPSGACQGREGLQLRPRQGKAGWHRPAPSPTSRSEIAFPPASAVGQAAQLLQNSLTKAGLQSKVVGYPWPTIVDKFKDPNTTPDVSIYWISTITPIRTTGSERYSRLDGGHLQERRAQNRWTPCSTGAEPDRSGRALQATRRRRASSSKNGGPVDLQHQVVQPLLNKLKGIVFCR